MTLTRREQVIKDVQLALEAAAGPEAGSFAVRAQQLVDGIIDVVRGGESTRDRYCRGCHGPFTAHDMRQVYCSPRCRVVVAQRNWRMRNPGKRYGKRRSQAMVDADVVHAMDGESMGAVSGDYQESRPAPTSYYNPQDPDPGWRPVEYGLNPAKDKPKC